MIPCRAVQKNQISSCGVSFSGRGGGSSLGEGGDRAGAQKARIDHNYCKSNVGA